MNYQSLFATAGTGTVGAGLIGAGQFGLSLVTQARGCDGLDIRALCDRDGERAMRVCRDAGYAESEVRACASADEAAAALAEGRLAVVEDGALLMSLPLDIIVEATGNAEAGAALADLAISHRKHVAMVTKEADIVVGALLQARARDAGVVCTPVDGDQPALLMGLVSWARVLGFDIVCAGKSSEYDFVFDARRERVSWRGRSIGVPGFAKLWRLGDDVAGTLAARADALHALPQRTVPDLCEMGLVCNATGMRPDVPAFHVPVARTLEVPGIFSAREHGGVLERAGTVDVFNCLRRPDEQSFAGGVFVVVACRDRRTWNVLAEKGIPVSADGRCAMLYNPQHLLGLEAPLSLMQAVRLGHSALGEPRAPVCDLVARAARDFRAGEVLEVTDRHHHEVEGLEPMLVDAAPLEPNAPLPYYMAVGRALTRKVIAGKVISLADVTPAPDSPLWRLRAEQDRLYA